MVVWILREGNVYLAADGGKVPVSLVTTYADVCEYHVSEFRDEAAARKEADDINRWESTRWEAVGVDFEDAQEEDFDEHFDVEES